MTTALQSAPAPSILPTASMAESARYALLRRLAPSMRHHLVVNLQPIGMIYEVMDRRLRAPEPNLADVRDSAHKINGFARAALNSCLDVVTWLAPEEDQVTTAAEGVSECLGLVATSLAFRGYALRNDAGVVVAEIPRAAIRNVLTAAIIHLTDDNPPPADIVIAGEAQGDGCVAITLTLGPIEGEKVVAGDAPYRRLHWEDVQALAAQESVVLAREGRQKLRLTIPIAGGVKS